MNITYTSEGVKINNNTFLSLKDITRECITCQVKENDWVILEIKYESWKSEQSVINRKEADELVEKLVGEEYMSYNIEGSIGKNDLEIISEESEVVDFLIQNPNGYLLTGLDQSILEILLDNLSDLMRKNQLSENQIQLLPLLQNHFK